MIRLSLRQFRVQGSVAALLLVLAALLLAATGPHLSELYAAFAKAQHPCTRTDPCVQTSINLSKPYQLLELLGTVLVAVPGLIGAFWGAPLISREFEHGTQRLVWTQSVSRRRWLIVKLGLVGLASVAATGLLSLMVTWWSSPIDRANANRFSDGLFGQRNIVPLGYAAFAFVLGVTLGLVVRRTLPAMATTLVLYLAVRLGFTYGIRQHLMSPVHATRALAGIVDGFGSENGGPPTLFANAQLPNAWIYSTRIVDGTGHDLTSHVVVTQCHGLLNPPGVPRSATRARVAPSNAAHDALHACITKLSSSYHGLVTYQPASRYWTFQWLETGTFVVAAVALAGFCFYWLRHHAA